MLREFQMSGSVNRISGGIGNLLRSSSKQFSSRRYRSQGEPRQADPVLGQQQGGTNPGSIKLQYPMSDTAQEEQSCFIFLKMLLTFL